MMTEIRSAKRVEVLEAVLGGGVGDGGRWCGRRWWMEVWEAVRWVWRPGRRCGE